MDVGRAWHRVVAPSCVSGYADRRPALSGDLRSGLRRISCRRGATVPVMPTFSTIRAAATAAVLAAVSAAMLVAPGGAQATVAPRTTVLARGLDAPKYLALGARGLYVTESGRGGRRCVRGVAGITETRVCAGATGLLVRIRRRHVATIVRGLASARVASTHGVSGVTAVGFQGRRMAVLFDDGGVGPTGVSGVAAPFGAGLGKLDLGGGRVGQRLAPVANIAAFQATHPQVPAALGGLPGETLYDSDPHDMVVYRGGFAIADAAANDVVWVHRSGRISLLARLPTRPEIAPPGLLGPGAPATPIRAQAVPSSVAVGPHGTLYVGLLDGIPALPGTATVDRVTPGRAPVPVVEGLTRVSDIAFDPHGRLDILENNVAGGPTQPTSTGALLRATLNGRGPTRAIDLGVRGLVDPVGLAVARTGVAYITDDSSAPGRGKVLAVTGLGRPVGSAR
jgi:hypothetical protein